LLRRIRALAPSPGAFTEIAGRLVVVQRARRAERYPAVLLPGEAAVVDGVAVVRTADAAIELIEAEIDDRRAGSRDLADLVAHARDKVIA
jgi:methionyl-tRNA formyltransferase